MFSIETSWPDVQAYFKTNDSVMIITGSLECHGIHNPLGVDTLVPEALAQQIEKQTEILALPALPFGSCDVSAGISRHRQSQHRDTAACPAGDRRQYAHSRRAAVFVSERPWR